MRKPIAGACWWLNASFDRSSPRRHTKPIQFGMATPLQKKAFHSNRSQGRLDRPSINSPSFLDNVTDRENVTSWVKNVHTLSSSPGLIFECANIWVYRVVSRRSQSQYIWNEVVVLPRWSGFHYLMMRQRR